MQEYVYLYNGKDFSFDDRVILISFKVADVLDPSKQMLRCTSQIIKKQDEVEKSFKNRTFDFAVEPGYLINRIQLTKKHLEDMPAWAQDSFNTFMENKKVKKALKKIILENQ